MRYPNFTKAYRNLLWVPDGSRQIFEKPETLAGTARLYAEIDQLVKNIYAHLDPLGRYYQRSNAQVLAKAVYL